MRKIALVIGWAGFAVACDEVVSVPDEGAVAAPAEPATEETAPDDALRVAEELPDPPERRFLEVRGQVTLDGRDAAVDMEIGSASSLETGSDGYAVITVEKGSTIEVRANSSLKLGRSERASTSVALAFGTLWSFMADESSYEVVTPNAVAGVRGTIFFVQVPPKKKKRQADRSYICACHGKVAIRGANPKSFDEVVHSPSEDHKAFDIITRGKAQKKRKAGRRNHTDEQKMALMVYTQRDE